MLGCVYACTTMHVFLHVQCICLYVCMFVCFYVCFYVSMYIEKLTLGCFSDVRACHSHARHCNCRGLYADPQNG